MASLLVLSLLCARVLIVHAGTVETNIANYHVIGETEIYSSGAVASTKGSTKGDMQTRVQATYYFYNHLTGELHSESKSDAQIGNSEVCFQLPGGSYTSYSVEAYHYASCNGSSWWDNSVEYYN